MGISCDDVVLIEHGKNPNDRTTTLVTVNCPDKLGLGCDLTRIVLDFGLYITRGDFSTDGRWCYVVFWVVPSPRGLSVDWESLRNRLLSVCPSCLIPDWYSPKANSSPPSLYLLKVQCLDRGGLLHDVTKTLSELELTIQRVKVMTKPDGKVFDLFFITDPTNSLHVEGRKGSACNRIAVSLGEYCISCELELAGPEFDSQQTFSCLPETTVEELLNHNPSSLDVDGNDTKVTKPTIAIDKTLSPTHTLLQIQCVDQKGLIYDILRTSKDCDVKISHGRISATVKGNRNMDVFIPKTFHEEKIAHFCSCMTEQMLHPVRVTIASRGPDTELLVANPVESSGNGRPLVFFDVTHALKALGICIFSAEIGRHSTKDGAWEVYRFRLEESQEFPLASKRAQQKIIDRVKRTLMGW